jgi:large subunit ribosomal protein L17
MVTSLFKYDRIQTTDVKAKELRRWADKLVTLAKRGDLHARRIALSIIRERDVVQKLFDEAGEKYGMASGGYTRIVKVGRRPGDAAPVSIIELISNPIDKKKKEKKPKKSAAGKPASPVEAKPVEEEKTETEPTAETAPVEAATEASAEPEKSEAETPVSEPETKEE